MTTDKIPSRNDTSIHNLSYSFTSLWRLTWFSRNHPKSRRSRNRQSQWALWPARADQSATDAVARHSQWPHWVPVFFPSDRRQIHRVTWRTPRRHRSERRWQRLAGAPHSSRERCAHNLVAPNWSTNWRPQCQKGCTKRNWKLQSQGSSSIRIVTSPSECRAGERSERIAEKWKNKYVSISMAQTITWYIYSIYEVKCTRTRLSNVSREL